MLRLLITVLGGKHCSLIYITQQRGVIIFLEIQHRHFICMSRFIQMQQVERTLIISMHKDMILMERKKRTQVWLNLTLENHML